MDTRHDPGCALQTAFGLGTSKVLLTVVEFGVFTRLGVRRRTGAELGAELEIDPRAVADFFDALVAMTGLSPINFEVLAKEFDFTRFENLCEVGVRAAVER